MKHFSIALMAAAALTSFGCSKKPKDGDATKSAEAAKPADPKPAPAPAPPSGDCTKNDEGGFCITLPADQKAETPIDRDEHSRTYSYASEKTNTGITVVVTKMTEASDWDDEVTSLAEEAKTKDNKEQQASDLPGGGKFASWIDRDGKNWITVLVHKDKDMKYLFCRSFGTPVAAVLVEACKSLRVL